MKNYYTKRKLEQTVFEDWHEYVFSVRTKVNVGEQYQLKFTQSGIKQGKNKVYMKCFIARRVPEKTYIIHLMEKNEKEILS